MKKIQKYNLNDVNTENNLLNSNKWNIPKFKEVSSLGKFLDKSEMGVESKAKLGIKLDFVLFEGTNKCK